MPTETTITTDTPALPPTPPRTPKTRDLVHAAALALLLEGRNPSWRAVRERIGQGSSTTLNDELKAFWAMVAERLRLPDLPEEVAQAALTFWEVAAKAGAGAFEDRRQAVERALKDAAAREAEAHHQATATATRLRDAQEQTHTLEDALTAARADLGQVTRRLEQATAQAQQAEALLSEVRAGAAQRQREQDATRKALEQRHAEALTELKADHIAALARERARNEANEQWLLNQLDALRTEQKARDRALSELKDQLSAERMTRTELKTQLDTLSQERQRVEAQLADVQGALQQLQVSASAREARLGTLTRERERLEGKHETLKAALEQAKVAATEQARALGHMRERLAASEAEAKLQRQQLQALQRHDRS